MELDPNFSEFIAALNAHEVRFLVVGGRRVEVRLGGVVVPFISLEDLRTNKRASGRAQDLADLAALSDVPEE